MAIDFDEIIQESFNKEIVREQLLQEIADLQRNEIVDDKLVDKIWLLCNGNPWNAVHHYHLKMSIKLQPHAPALDDKYVCIMCDYGADGVWNKNGDEEARDWLPVTQDIKSRLQRWQEVYDSCQEFNAVNDITFMQEGLSIAIEIKKQLPDWTVEFFNLGFFNLTEDEKTRNIKITDEMVKKSDGKKKLIADLDIALEHAKQLEKVVTEWGTIMEASHMRKANLEKLCSKDSTKTEIKAVKEITISKKKLSKD